MCHANVLRNVFRQIGFIDQTNVKDRPSMIERKNDSNSAHLGYAMSSKNYKYYLKCNLKTTLSRDIERNQSKTNQLSLLFTQRTKEKNNKISQRWLQLS